MSVLIKGVDLPKDRDTLVLVRVDGSAIVYTDEAYLTTTVPVPTPHGDLIDRNALPWENQGLMLTDPDEWGLKAWDIEHAPTIIEAEGEDEL